MASLTEDTEHATTPQSSPPTPTPAEAHTSPDLSALLSPTHTEHRELGFHIRDSVADSEVADSEFGDVPLDESHFSTVSLNARNSTQAVKSPPSLAGDAHLPSELNLDSPGGAAEEYTDEEVGMKTATKARFDFDALKRLSAPSSEQKRNSAAMILHRLDAQRDTDEKRSSADGQTKLQEEFSKVQIEAKDEEVAEGIDWGAFHYDLPKHLDCS